MADQPGGRERLHAMLQAVDSVSAERLHVNDVRRVIRALEVYRLTGKPFSEQAAPERPGAFRYRVASLDMDRALLYRRIEQRVDQMIAMGLLCEVRALLDSGVPSDAQSMKGLGYKELIPCLRGECTLEEAVYEMKKGTRHYAKRQLTWMRREEDVKWIDPTSPGAYEALEKWFVKGEA